MADRYTIDTTRFIPPNLRGIASTLGLDDASNMNAVVSMFMRPRDAAARYSEPEKYSPTGKRETSDLIEAGMGPAEALLGVGVGRFLSEPIRRTLMSMLGIDSGDVSKFSTTDRSVPETDFEAMYGGDRGGLDAASMTDSELLDRFNREYPDAEDVALQSAMFDDEEMGLPVGDYYVPDWALTLAEDIQEMLDNGATPAEVRQLMDQQSRLNVDPTDDTGLTRYVGYDPSIVVTDEYFAAEAAAQARDDAGIVDEIPFTDDDAYTGLTDADPIGIREFDPNDPFSAVGYEGDGTPVPGAFADLTQVPMKPPEVSYEIVDRKDGLQAALQTVSRKSGLKFPDGEAAVKALKSQGVTDAELEARGLMSLKDLTNFDGTAAAKMLSGFQERMTGGKFSDDIDLSPPIKITELRGAGTEYDQYFTKGGTDYLETVYTLRDSNLGPDLSRDLKNRTLSHHSDIQQGAEGPTLFHTRSAVFDVDGGGSTFHLGEIQSDVNGLSRAVLKSKKLLEDLGSDKLDTVLSIYTGKQKNTPAEEQEILSLLEGTKFGDGFVRDHDSQGSVQGGIRSRFSQLPSEEQAFLLVEGLLDNRNKSQIRTASELGVGKLYDTATITRMAIRRSLEQASDSGADFFTLGTGQMAKDMTFGDLGGQQEYYDKIVPGALKKVLNKLGADSKLEMPKVEEIPMYGADRDGAETVFMVPGFRMTDDFRKALSEVGLPMFKDGGRVDVSRFTGLGSMGYML